jgi:hypothetical protein
MKMLLLGGGFELGEIYFTPGVLALPPYEVLSGIARHAREDWGDICEEDRGLNEQSLMDGTRILSVYHTKAGDKVFIITEADRSSTTVMLAEEY